MNDLQKLIALRGLTAFQIAQDTGANYHSVQKTIKGVRIIHCVQPVVAEYLGLDPDRAWGPGARSYLRKLIAEEIDRQSAGERKRLRDLYLRDSAARVPKNRRSSNA